MTKERVCYYVLGLAEYYKRCIRNFCKLAAPMTDLTKEGFRFEWMGNVKMCSKN